MKCFKKNVYINKIKLLDYSRIEVSKGIDVNKTSAAKECIICHYWYFSDKEIKFQSSVCNGCLIVLMMAMNLKDVCYFKHCEDIYLLENADLSEISRTLQNI